MLLNNKSNLTLITDQLNAQILVF